MSGDCSHRESIWKESSCRPSVLHCSPQTTHPNAACFLSTLIYHAIIYFQQMTAQNLKTSATKKNLQQIPGKKVVASLPFSVEPIDCTSDIGAICASMPCTAACDVLAERNSCLCVNGNPGFGRCLQCHWWHCCDCVGAGSRALQLLMMALVAE